MKTFYKALLNHFEKPEVKQKFTEKNLSPLKYIDLYNGQDLDEKASDAKLFPALLLSWSVDHNEGVANINFRIAHEQLRDTNNWAQDIDLSLQYLDYVDVIDECLQELESATTGKLELVNESMEHEPTIVDVYLLDYTANYSGKQHRRTTRVEQFDVFEINKQLKERLS